MFGRMELLRKNRNYRLLISASAISNLGDGISAMAFPWLATMLTRDPFSIAAVAMASRLPWFFFPLPVGVLIDRLDRRQIMIQADVFRFILTFGVIALIFSAPPLPADVPQTVLIWLLALAAFLLGTAEVFRDNAAQTILPSLVEKRDLEVANGNMWSAEQIMGAFVGPPLAGVLIATWVPLPFGANALAFVLSAWALWCISMTRIAPAKNTGFKAELIEGLAWLWRHKTILRLAVMLGVLNALAIMNLTVLVLFSQEILGLGAAGHGMLLTAGAIGGVVGGLISPAIIAKIGAWRGLMLALAIFPLPPLLVGLTSNIWLVAFALFVDMVAVMLWNVVTVSWRQRLIPDNLLGRVNAAYRFFGWGMMPFGALAGGILVSMVEPQLGRDMALRLPWLLSGAGSAVMLAYGLRRLNLE